MAWTWIESTETAPWTLREAGTPCEASSDLTLDESTTYQTVRGFGGCFNELGWRALQTLTDEQREATMQILFAKDGCAFTLCRMPIGASDYADSWYSLNETDGDYAMAHFSIERDRGCLLPFIQSAQAIAPNLSLFASPWSPPTWMKTKRAYNHGNLINTPENLQAYALYFQKFVEAYAAEGVNIAQIHVQNEPNSDQKFPSCVWTGEQMRDFIRDYLGPHFEVEGIDCEIWAGTIERAMIHGWESSLIGQSDYAQWAHTILSDNAARKYIAGVGYQWDGKGVIQRTHIAWPDMPIMQTENECGNGENTWDYAHYVFDLVWHYFTNGAVAYTYWNMVLPDGGLSTWGWKQNSMFSIFADGTVRPNPEYYVIRHIAHYVKPGAVRVGLTGMLAAYALAFRNPDGTTVIVAANPLNRPEPIRVVGNGQELPATLSPRSFHTFICQLK